MEAQISDPICVTFLLELFDVLTVLQCLMVYKGIYIWVFLSIGFPSYRAPERGFKGKYGV